MEVNNNSFRRYLKKSGESTKNKVSAHLSLYIFMQN